jgi:exodeoxyribonuclease VII large subunit
MTHNNIRKQLITEAIQLTDQADRRLTALEAHLRALSPLATLERGYAIVHTEKGKSLVRSARQLAAGVTIQTRFADGAAQSRVESVSREQPGRLTKPRPIERKQ